MDELDIVSSATEGFFKATLNYLPKTTAKIDNILSNILEYIPWSNSSTRRNKNLANNLLPYIENIIKINDDELIPPLLDIAVPVIEKLSYIESNDVKQIYINLLTMATHREKSKVIHPAVLNNILNLTNKDIELIKFLIDSKEDNFINPQFVINYSNGGHDESPIIFIIFAKDGFIISTETLLTIENLTHNGFLQVSETGTYSPKIEQKMFTFLNDNFQNSKSGGAIEARDIYHDIYPLHPTPKTPIINNIFQNPNISSMRMKMKIYKLTKMGKLLSEVLKIS